MDFYQITVKIFKANFRRYLLFFLCSSFSVMVFFTFMTLVTNKDFMDPYRNSGYSNIIAPSIVTGIFSVFFTIYAQGSFIRFRKKEFGTFMVLGMTTGDIRRIMLIENSIICLLSLAAGMAAGTVFSWLFFYTATKISDTRGIPFSLSIMSYAYTTAFFLIIYLLIIAGGFIASTRYEIVKLIKSNRRDDRNYLDHPAWIIAGAVLVALSSADMLKNFDTQHSTVLLRSMLVCFIGIYLIVSNLIRLLSKVIDPLNRRLDDSILYIADLKYGFGRSKKVIFLIVILISVVMFFCNLGGVSLNDSLTFALEHNPYDISFNEMYSFNRISDAELADIASQSETPLLSIKSLDMVVFKYPLIFLSDKNMNEQLGTDITVQKGKFVSLFQYIPDDGYPHEPNKADNITVPVGRNQAEFELQENITKVIFGTGTYYILNDNDFKNICENSADFFKGSIKLMSYKDWRRTEKVSALLSERLEAYNTKNAADYTQDAISMMSKPDSKIGSYLDSKHGYSYFLFLIFFVSMLFLLSSAAILHFHLLTEFESERLKYRKLYKIGITSDEVRNMVSKKLKFLFYTPFAIAISVSTFFGYSIFPRASERFVSLEYSAAVASIVICLTSCFNYAYEKTYTKRLLKALEG